jgi:hypothetical protein
MHNGLLGQSENARQSSWNKGKLIGLKPPRRTKDVWSIVTNLQVEERIRDSAMFQSSHPQQAARKRCGPPEG